MGQVTATKSIDINATPEKVLAALSDYSGVRPQILPDEYLDFQVLTGGTGTGTVAEWTLQATSKRSRDVKATVGVVDSTITERDDNSSMITEYKVVPKGTGSTVVTTTTWAGAGGIGGFFERTFAPKGLNKIQDKLLGNLKGLLEK
ncbi:SRPBCC family protein [Williamsia sterculiae]|uniref:Polyketide cyclase / dehydrase and lipid transport n=1 Tax=Williamsia sterculiae TaxID=1344003 RepID=A0A1N7F6N2_9NOCA|nr:SRPBCC family protein [Williamsia sterculiae]SIR95959.1 Polyketide cyclase / dehydrase and lipid transport [Williamsia sterculiae]